MAAPIRPRRARPPPAARAFLLRCRVQWAAAATHRALAVQPTPRRRPGRPRRRQRPAASGRWPRLASRHRRRPLPPRRLRASWSELGAVGRARRRAERGPRAGPRGLGLGGPPRAADLPRSGTAVGGGMRAPPLLPAAPAGSGFTSHSKGAYWKASTWMTDGRAPPTTGGAAWRQVWIARILALKTSHPMRCNDSIRTAKFGGERRHHSAGAVASSAWQTCSASVASASAIWASTRSLLTAARDSASS